MDKEPKYYVERIFDTYPDGILGKNLTNEEADKLIDSQRKRYKVSYRKVEETNEQK